VAIFLVQTEDVRALIARIESMRNNLEDVVGSLHASRDDLRKIWQGSQIPTLVEAEMNQIEESIKKNTEALDRLAQIIKQVMDAYENADQQISQAFNV